jgi:hypothetical protein
MARRTLRQVKEKAFREAKFWKALRRNPEGALSKARIELSAADLRKLKRMLESNVLKVDLNKFMSEVHHVQDDFPTWRSWIDP